MKIHSVTRTIDTRGDAATQHTARIEELLGGTTLGRIRAQLDREDWHTVPGESDRQVRMEFIGTIMNLTPSGKYYVPFAASNVAGDCTVCGGKGDVPNPAANTLKHTRAVYRHQQLVKNARKEQDKYSGSAPVGIWKRARLAAHDATKFAPTITCETCNGEGSESAAKDARWHEELEESLGFFGLYLEHGEGDPCDLFVAECRDVPDAEESEDDEDEAPMPKGSTLHQRAAHTHEDPSDIREVKPLTYESEINALCEKYGFTFDAEKGGAIVPPGTSTDKVCDFNDEMQEIVEKYTPAVHGLETHHVDTHTLDLCCGDKVDYLRKLETVNLDTMRGVEMASNVTDEDEKVTCTRCRNNLNHGPLSAKREYGIKPHNVVGFKGAGDKRVPTQINVTLEDAKGERRVFLRKVVKYIRDSDTKVVVAVNAKETVVDLASNDAIKVDKLPAK